MPLTHSPAATLRARLLAALAEHPHLTLNQLQDEGIMPRCQAGVLGSFCWSMVEDGLLERRSDQPGGWRVTDAGHQALAQIGALQESHARLDRLRLV
jgi:hypothetical protein